MKRKHVYWQHLLLIIARRVLSLCKNFESSTAYIKTAYLSGDLPEILQVRYTLCIEVTAYAHIHKYSWPLSDVDIHFLNDEVQQRGYALWYKAIHAVLDSLNYQIGEAAYNNLSMRRKNNNDFMLLQAVASGHRQYPEWMPAVLP